MSKNSQSVLKFVPRQVDGCIIDQRSTDGYINATTMCNAAGKKFSHYSESAKAFISQLSVEAGIPASVLIQSIHGGAKSGTWVHPQIAIHLGQ